MCSVCFVSDQPPSSQIVKRLREERTGFDSHLISLEDTMKGKEKDHEEHRMPPHGSLNPNPNAPPRTSRS